MRIAGRRKRLAPEIDLRISLLHGRRLRGLHSASSLWA